MAGGWIPMPVDTWPDVVALLESKGEEWTKSLAAYDLRWHENEVRMGRRKSMPGAPFFSERWGWSRYYTRGLMRNEEAWVDSRFARPLPVGCPPIARENNDKQDSSVDGSPPSARPLPANHHTRVGEQPNNSTTEQEELVSPQASDERKQPAGWDDVMKAWNTYAKARGDKSASRIQPKGGLKTEGGSLVSMLKAIGKDRLCELLEWCATDQTGRGSYYRTSGYGAVNMRRNYPELLRLMDRTKAAPHNGSNGPASATPGHMFLRAYESARGRHPAWLDYVPSDERERFERAARQCNGLTMVRAMSAHPIAKKETIETFNQAFEAAK